MNLPQVDVSCGAPTPHRRAHPAISRTPLNKALPICAGSDLARSMPAGSAPQQLDCFNLREPSSSRPGPTWPARCRQAPRPSSFTAAASQGRVQLMRRRQTQVENLRCSTKVLETPHLNSTLRRQTHGGNLRSTKVCQRHLVYQQHLLHISQWILTGITTEL